MTPVDTAPEDAPSDPVLHELLGLEWVKITSGSVTARMPVQRRHMAPHGYLHAASVIGLADSACGFGCMASLPEGASSFTTIELKSNFLGTVQVGGAVACSASMAHGGKRTQIWDATVTDEATGKAIALFRCTQMILYPKA